MDRDGTPEGPCVVSGSSDHGTAKHPIEPGDRIWVGTTLYMSHGVDDFIGGVATVSGVRPGISCSQPATYVSVKERPGIEYNWEFLAGKQAEMKERHGDSPAHADPDDRPQFSEWAGPGDTVTETRYDTCTGIPQTTTRTLGPGEHMV